MKNFLLALFPNLTAKAAITAAVCVTAGAAVTATATTVAYNKKAASYEQTIDSLSAAQSEAKAANDTGRKGTSPESATAVRVVDGTLQVWDGEKWDDYGSVDDIVSGDPFYGNDEKKQEVEQNVAAKKLDELGLMINEQGEIVRKENAEETEVAAGKTDTVILVGSTAVKENNAKPGDNKNNTGQNSGNNKASAAASTVATTAGLTPEQVMAAIQGARGIASAPIASQTVTTVSWTAQSSSDGGGSSDSGSSSSGGESYTAPASTPAATTTETTTQTETPTETNNDEPPQPDPQPAFDEGTGDDIQ